MKIERDCVGQKSGITRIIMSIGFPNMSGYHLIILSGQPGRATTITGTMMLTDHLQRRGSQVADQGYFPLQLCLAPPLGLLLTSLLLLGLAGSSCSTGRCLGKRERWLHGSRSARWLSLLDSFDRRSNYFEPKLHFRSGSTSRQRTLLHHGCDSPPES